MSSRRFMVLVLVTIPWLFLVTCGIHGSGVPVPIPPTDFAVGATIPGWVLTIPGAGRADIDAVSTHANGRWNVVFSRPIRTRPREIRFSMAVMDNSTAHAGKQLIRLTSDPTVLPDSETVVAKRVANGQVLPNGVLAPGEWDSSTFSFLINDSQDELPSGKSPPTVPLAMTTAAAYDDEYIYFLLRWTDSSLTPSALGPQLQWNGTGWQPRPNRGNDLDGNGLLDAGETMTFAAPAEDEDRVALFFPVHDGTGAFRAGQSGCADSCHRRLDLDPSGSEAVHSWLLPDDRTDVWVWRAARTAPARHADDLMLGMGATGAGLSTGGSGFQADQGTAPFIANPLSPSFMFGTPQNGPAFLVQGPITFDALAEPGYPVLPPVPSTTVPFAAADFNHTGIGPATWTGAPPFQNDFLPAFVQQQPAGSRADIETGSSYNAALGQWTVEMRRRRTTRDDAGLVRTDDVQFDDDSRFLQDAFNIGTANLGLPFSVSITDRASGHGVGETLYPGPLLLARDESVSGAALDTALLMHDYGAGFAPASAADFTDVRETHPIATAGTDVGLRLKAGTDGGNTLFVLASWDDATLDAGRDQWTWDGFFWRQSGGEDECRILWNGTVPRGAFMAGGGCAYLCHGGGGPLGAPPVPHFSSTAVNELADLWRWGAGRGAPVSKSDDEHVDWRFFTFAEGGSPNAAVHGDAGRSLFRTNADASRPFPLFMGPDDPVAGSDFLTLDIPGLPDAVSFQDVLRHLPPPPPGGSGAPVSFAAQILPIFQVTCSACHPPTGGLNVQSYAGVLSGGQSGLSVVPGNPGASLLLKRLRGEIQPQMPLFGPYLTNEQVQLISDWISQGAPNN